MYVVKRSKHNPFLIPNRDHYWEEFVTFNLCPIKKGFKYHGFYRAISAPDELKTPHQMSIIGKAESLDGIHFTKRVPFIEPKEEWEKYLLTNPYYEIK